MLQPDLFFAYGLSSGIAAAAGKQLKKQESVFVNKYFLALALWLAVFYIPQAFFLLRRFTGWESMFMIREFYDVPGWLYGLYPAAAFIMAALGFYVAASLIKRGKPRAAIAQLPLGILIACLIMAVGWDGTGYQRLFYVGSGADWQNRVSYPILDWFTSPIARTLAWLETIVMIPYFVMFIRWARGK